MIKPKWNLIVLLALVFGLLTLPVSPGRAANLSTDEAAPTVPKRDYDALRRFEKKSTRQAVVHTVRGFPEAVRGDVAVKGKTPVARARAFLKEYAALYGTNDANSVLHVRRVSGPHAKTVTFTQEHKGFPVYGASLTVTTTETSVIGTNGRILTRPLVDAVPAITDTKAETIARKATGQQQASVVGETSLVVFDRSLLFTDGAVGTRLAWRVTLGRAVPTEVLVDAETAEVLLVDEKGHEDSDLESFDLEIVDAEGDANAEEDDCYWSSDDTGAADEDGVYDDYLADLDVTVAFEGAKQAYRAYHKFGRHGFDDDSTEMEIFVHAKERAGKGPNAYFFPCGSGYMMEINEDHLDDETVMHEWGHGVINTSSDLACCDQSGALEESYADVMAVLATDNWLYSENKLNGNGPTRNLANPTDMLTNSNPGAGHLDGMSVACPGEFDDERVHCKQGVPNKAHFLISTGAPDAGIGKNPTALLAYLAMTNLPSNATFLTARNAEVQYAELFRDYWSPNSPIVHTPLFDASIPQGWTDEDVCGVIQGWAGVGVGDGDMDCDGVDDGADDTDGDGVMDAADNCPGWWQGISDADADGIGDVCDPDADGDGVNEAGPGGDNCPGNFNPDQTDADFDGRGQACDFDEDDDLDNDLTPNADDNCPSDFNHDQEDIDNDGQGDECDPDGDGDERSNDDDNCPFVANASQTDSDGDGFGDACDECAFAADANGGYTTGVPELGIEPEPYVPDADGDGTPDACDNDPFSLGGPLKVNGKKPGPFVMGKPGDRARTLETPIRAGGKLSLPIDVCAKKCPDGFDEKVRMVVECRDLPANARLWVSDLRGDPVGGYQAGAKGGAQARFHPEIGNSYVMHIGFAPKEEKLSQSLRTSCRFTSEAARTGK